MQRGLRQRLGEAGVLVHTPERPPSACPARRKAGPERYGLMAGVVAGADHARPGPIAGACPGLDHGRLPVPMAAFSGSGHTLPCVSRGPPCPALPPPGCGTWMQGRARATLENRIDEPFLQA